MKNQLVKYNKQSAITSYSSLANNQFKLKVKANNFFHEDWDLNKLTNAAKKIKVTDSSAANKASNYELQTIITEIARAKKCELHEAFAALALLAQMGATSARTQPGVNVSIGKTEFKIELIRKIIKNVTGKSFRRLAKTFAKEFKEIAETNQYPGNLYNKIKLNYPDFTLEKKEDKYWVSDFQAETPECPIYIRNILNKYYNDYIKKDKKK